MDWKRAHMTIQSHRPYRSVVAVGATISSSNWLHCGARGKDSHEHAWVRVRVLPNLLILVMSPTCRSLMQTTSPPLWCSSLKVVACKSKKEISR